jgi:hypothetical protein
MATSTPSELAKAPGLRETRFANRSLSQRQAVSFRPPSFRIILCLVGACLVLWGAKGVVLNIPGLQEFSLFGMNYSAAWAMVISTVAVVMLAWFRPAVFAWIGWCVAVGALAWLLNDLWDKVRALSAGFAEMKAAGVPAPDLDKILKSTQIKPGAVAIGSGLIIQAVGLCLKHKLGREAK